jgi:RimJ/RimL family protein N-acetyltransferase
MLLQVTDNDRELFRAARKLTAAPKLTSERLILRAWQPEDIEGLVRMYGDVETMQHLDGPQSREEIMEFFPVRIERWQAEGWGAWAVELKDQPGIMGVVGYGPPRAPFEGYDACLDFGWLIDKEDWGRGLATEAARLALVWGFEERHLAHVLATPDSSNQSSRRLCEKLSMSHLISEGSNVIYSVSREDWKRRN